MRRAKVFKYLAITFTIAVLIGGLYVYTDYFKEKQVNNTLVSKGNAIESENLTSKDKESSVLEELDESKEAAFEENKDNPNAAEEVKETEIKKEENKDPATTNIASGHKDKGATGNTGGAPLDGRGAEEPKAAQESPAKPKQEPQPVKEEPKETAPSPEAPTPVENKKEQQPPKESSNTSPTYLPNNYSFSYGEAIENEVIALVNALRKENGLATLSYDSSLRESARYKSNSMLQHEYFSHNNPQLGGKGMSYLLWDVFKINSTRVGENIAYYQGPSEKITAKQIYEQWYNSAPHREAMLSTGFTRIGVGIVLSTKGGTSSCMYGTQHFAK